MVKDAVWENRALQVIETCSTRKFILFEDMKLVALQLVFRPCFLSVCLFVCLFAYSVVYLLWLIAVCCALFWWLDMDYF
jgi:hypothetical protein